MLRRVTNMTTIVSKIIRTEENHNLSLLLVDRKSNYQKEVPLEPKKKSNISSKISFDTQRGKIIPLMEINPY